MSENLFEAQYDITQKSKLRRFYEKNKTVIYLLVSLLIILLISFSFYITHKEKKKILLSEDYIKAKIYLDNDKKNEALEILKQLLLENDESYSTLAFFMILDQNLINDYEELSNMFEHLLKKNKYEKEMNNLLIYKKALLDSKYVDESKLLKDLNPLTKSESIWKPHALLLIGDYFVERKEYIKAKQFYLQILSEKNLEKVFYELAKNQLSLIENDK